MKTFSFETTSTYTPPLRESHPQWKYRLVAASITVSLIGAFTSTQLMCSARVAKSSLAVFTWIMLGSFIFDFCGMWALHEVAMLACQIDVHVGIDPFRTTLSALLAAVSTFAALGSGPPQQRYRENRRKDWHSWMRRRQTEQLESEGFSTIINGTQPPTSVRDGYYDRNRSLPDTERDLGEEEEDEVDVRSDSTLLSTLSPHRTWPETRDTGFCEEIAVVSNYKKDVPEGENGTTFAITIPLAHSVNEDSQMILLITLPKVAILQTIRNARSTEGQYAAWQKAGFMPSLVNGLDDLTSNDWKWVCADIDSLTRQSSLREHLSNSDYTVLLPFNTQNELRQLADLTSLHRIVPIQKPLRWHTFDARVTASKYKPTILTRARFAPDETHASEASSRLSSSASKAPTRGFTILLAGDNPINQRLGGNMLASLGYDIIVAEDGQDAVNQIRLHDVIVDAILMDQSMPRKDGAEATREIRALEKAGTLKRASHHRCHRRGRCQCAGHVQGGWHGRFSC